LSLGEFAEVGICHSGVSVTLVIEQILPLKNHSLKVVVEQQDLDADVVYFCKLAEAQNCRAIRCTNLEELPAKMKEFLECKEPVVMECLVNKAEHRAPPCCRQFFQICTPDSPAVLSLGEFAEVGICHSGVSVTLKEFLECKEPVVMECLVNKAEHVYPMVAAGKALHEVKVSTTITCVTSMLTVS
jgi:thiamine pyrophosphate-dependent acetolactate synthase large subunit-like protein